MSDYQFFFSYAGHNYTNATWQCRGTGGDYFKGNYLEDFYDEICKEVSDLSVNGISKDDVGCRDINKLRLSEDWNQELTRGLQDSRVLLAVLSPHYIKSEFCGKEFQFFRERLKKLYLEKSETSTIQSEPSRIVPVYWLSNVSCKNMLSAKMLEFINTLQHRQLGMPLNYPSMGLVEMYRKQKVTEHNLVIKEIAYRINELAALPMLPLLDSNIRFSSLPSAFHSNDS